jgi:putative tryptophan/tyrosine transport system substrate-binding protein
MKRREFIAGLGGVVTWPLAVRAQQGAMPVIGVLKPGSPDTTTARMTAFLQSLKEGGYIEGRNVALEYRWGEGHFDRLPALAADLVGRQVKVIVTAGGVATLKAKAATSTIPIVFQLGEDPVGLGLVANLNRPGGNVTGVNNITATLGAKRIELLHKLVPKADKIGVFIDPNTAAPDTQRTALQEAASALGLQLIFLRAGNEQEIDAAFTTLVQQRVGALFLIDSAFFSDRREQLVTLARFNAIPTMYTFRDFAETGGLMSYSSSLTDAYRRVGIYVSRILKGENPADLPVQLPTKFELVINLKTAKALGLTIPPNLLAVADEVIE